MPDAINEQQIIETATSFGTGNVSCLILSIMGKDRDVIKTKPHPIRKIHRELQNRKIMEVASVFKYIISIYKRCRPQFSTNPTYENPLKNPTFYIVEADF